MRTTVISLGAVSSELKLGSTDSGSAAGVKAFYEVNEIPADSVGRAIAYAIAQPAEVDSAADCAGLLSARAGRHALEFGAADDRF